MNIYVPSFYLYTDSVLPEAFSPGNLLYFPSPPVEPIMIPIPSAINANPPTIRTSLFAFLFLPIYAGLARVSLHFFTLFSVFLRCHFSKSHCKLNQRLSHTPKGFSKSSNLFHHAVQSFLCFLFYDFHIFLHKISILTCVFQAHFFTLFSNLSGAFAPDNLRYFPSPLADAAAIPSPSAAITSPTTIQTSLFAFFFTNYLLMRAWPAVLYSFYPRIIIPKIFSMNPPNSQTLFSTISIMFSSFPCRYTRICP